ncbi:hypothetical protein MRX96_038564 [Rhipicephalus microplus]
MRELMSTPRSGQDSGSSPLLPGRKPDGGRKRRCCHKNCREAVAERSPVEDGTQPSTPVTLERHEQLGRGDKRRLAQGSEEQYLQKCER